MLTIFIIAGVVFTLLIVFDKKPQTSCGGVRVKEHPTTPKPKGKPHGQGVRK